MEKENEVISRSRGGYLDVLVTAATRGYYGVESQILGFSGFEDLHTGKSVSDPLESGLSKKTGKRKKVGLVIPKPIVKRVIIKTK